MNITVLVNNMPCGPFTRTQIAQKLEAREITLDSLAFAEGLGQWTPLREVLSKVDAAARPAPAPPPFVQPPAYSYAVTMQPPSHLTYAGFWIRVAAHLLDNLIISIPFFALWIIFIMMFIGFGAFTVFSQVNASPNDPAVTASIVRTVIIIYVSIILINLIRFIAVWLYHAITESGPSQATFGKRILGLKVTGMTGERITFGRASGRYFSTIVTGMTMGIGYLMVAFTDQKQALHDMIAGTLVVKK